MASVIEVEAVFQDAYQHLHELANLNSATPADREVSRDALNDLLLLHGTHVIQQIEGRTAILTGLITELEDVVQRIQASKSVADVINKIKDVILGARDIYAKAKDELRT